MKNLNVNPKDLNMLLDIITSYCPDSEIWAYGSRVGGDSHSGSDLDLAIKRASQEFDLSVFKELLSESNIPFIVDVHEFENLPVSFQKEILKNYIVIYNK